MTNPFRGCCGWWSIDRAMIGAAAQQGVATIMTGYGDDIFDMQPFHLTELLRSGADATETANRTSQTIFMKNL
jgi:hypothetical protein